MPKNRQIDNGQSWTWEIELEQPDAGAVWLSCVVEEQWRIRVRLITNGYRTAMDQFQVAPLESARVLGIRGSLELPRGDTGREWMRLPLHRIRLEATTHLHHALAEHDHHASLTWPTRAQDAPPPSSPQPVERRTQITDVPLLHAKLEGFTTTATRPRRDVRHAKGDLRLALVAAAYEAAATRHPRATREHVHRWLTELGFSYKPETIGQLIHKARIAGLLSKGQPGTVTGTATPLAHTLLDESEFRDLPWSVESNRS
jgi:hypothetical protein